MDSPNPTASSSSTTTQTITKPNRGRPKKIFHNENNPATVVIPTPPSAGPSRLHPQPPTKTKSRRRARSPSCSSHEAECTHQERSHDQPLSQYPPGLRWYIKHLDDHIQASVPPQQDPAARVSQELARQVGRTPTIIPPHSVWTAHDKAALFAAISRHSRLRPDLIARDVGRPEVEVVAYLSALRSAEKYEGRGVCKPLKSSRKGFYHWREGLAPAAREVDDDWLVKEEKMAEEVELLFNNRTAKRARQDQLEERKREKRCCQAEIRRTSGFAKDIPKTTLMRQSKILAKPKIDKLEERYEIEDFGISIGVPELATLDGLLMPQWSQGYQDSLNVPDAKDIDTLTMASNRQTASTDGEVTPKAKRTSKKIIPQSRIDNEEGESEIDMGVAETKGFKTTCTTQSKGDEIVAEMKELAELMAMPRSSLSAMQQKQLTKLRNKKRNRERYRLMKLIAEGMTEEEIDLAGGPDAIFAAREEPSAVGSGSGSRSGSSPPSMSRNNESREKENDERSDPIDQVNKVIADDEVQKLGALNTHVYLTERGWDVFNFDFMSQIIESMHPEGDATVSFELFDQLHSRLLAYLEPLMHQVIQLAEQQALITPKNSTDQNKKSTKTPSRIGGETEEGDNSEGLFEITAEHVQTVLALRGEKEGLKTSLGILSRSAGRETVTSTLPIEPTDENQSGRLKYVDRWKIPLADASRPTSSALFNKNENEESGKSVMDQHVDGETDDKEDEGEGESEIGEDDDDDDDDADESDDDEDDATTELASPSSSTEEREDLALDMALDKVDEAYDLLLLSRLHSAVEMDDPKTEIGHLDDPFVKFHLAKNEREGRLVAKQEENQRVAEVESGKTEKAVVDAIHARSAYVKLLYETQNSRRSRLAMKERSCKFPTSKLRLQGAGMRDRRSSKAVTSMYIDDDDDDDDEEDDDDDEVDEDEDGGYGDDEGSEEIGDDIEDEERVVKLKQERNLED